MKANYLIGLILIVLLSSCGNSKEKREIKAQQQKIQKTKDSTKYIKAIALYDKQEWDSAIVAFKNVQYSNFYGKQSKN